MSQERAGRDESKDPGVGPGHPEDEARNALSFDFRPFPGGGRIIRAQSPEMLLPFDRELEPAAREFVKRAKDTTSPAKDDGYGPDHVLEMLRLSSTNHDDAVWLVLDERYRLLGFLVVSLVVPIGAYRLEAQILAYYMFPKRPAYRAAPVLSEMLDAWARSKGVARIVFLTHRARPLAWGRHGYEPIGQIYGKSLERKVVSDGQSE